MEKARDMAVQRVGEGFPVLIVHGWSMAGFVESHDFEPIFTKHTGYCRIYVDLPGMGSSPLGTVRDLDSMLERLSAFVERDILPSRFLLTGSSCGAYLARALAYKYASSVDGLLLRVPLVEPVSSKRDVDPFVPVLSNEVLLSSLCDADREQLGDIPIQTSDYCDTLRQRLEATVLPAIAALDPAISNIRNDPSRYKLTAALHSPSMPFMMPALILTGRHDTDVGYRDAWPLTASYPRATFVVLDRADHGLPVDNTALFAALVNDWLWRVEEMQKVDSST